jgi:hypothetical protein
MTSYTVTNGGVGAHAKVLSANAVDTVTFQPGASGTPGWARMPKKVEVLTDGLADVYFTVDGSVPTVGGANCYRVPIGGTSSLAVPVADSNPHDAVVVKLISSGAPTYSVSRAG